MTDPSILAIRRDLKYRSLAEALGVEGNSPSTKLPPMHMELFQGDLLEAIIVRIQKLEAENKKLKSAVKGLDKLAGALQEELDDCQRGRCDPDCKCS